MELIRSNSDILFKNRAEIAGVSKTGDGSGFAYTYIVHKEKSLGFVDARFRDVLIRTHIHNLFENPAEMLRRYVYDCAKVGYDNVVAEIFIDIFYDGKQHGELSAPRGVKSVVHKSVKVYYVIINQSRTGIIAIENIVLLTVKHFFKKLIN